MQCPVPWGTRNQVQLFVPEQRPENALTEFPYSNACQRGEGFVLVAAKTVEAGRVNGWPCWSLRFGQGLLPSQPACLEGVGHRRTILLLWGVCVCGGGTIGQRHALLG